MAQNTTRTAFEVELPQPVSAKVDREEIRNRVDKQQIWRHRIPVGLGLYTPGREDSRLDIVRFRFDPCAHQRVLDVGASDGYFSFYHETVLQASSVVAIDNFVSTPNDGEYTAIRIAADLRESKVEISEKSVYDLDPTVDGMFDRMLIYSMLLPIAMAG